MTWLRCARRAYISFVLCRSVTASPKLVSFLSPLYSFLRSVCLQARICCVLSVVTHLQKIAPPSICAPLNLEFHATWAHTQQPKKSTKKKKNHPGKCYVINGKANAKNTTHTQKKDTNDLYKKTHERVEYRAATSSLPRGYLHLSFIYFLLFRFPLFHFPFPSCLFFFLDLSPSRKEVYLRDNLFTLYFFSLSKKKCKG